MKKFLATHEECLGK